MRVVAALGGNALLRRGEALTAENQRERLGSVQGARARRARARPGHLPRKRAAGRPARAAGSVHAGRRLPARRAGGADRGDDRLPHPAGARQRAPVRTHLATLLTQIEVDPDDPAFSDPTKPIGPIYDEAEAERLAAEGLDVQARRRQLAARRPLPAAEAHLRDRGDRRAAPAGLCRYLRRRRWDPDDVHRRAAPAGKRLVGVEAVIDRTSRARCSRSTSRRTCSRS